MQKISVNTILRADRPKNGLLPIYIRIVVDRKKIDVRVAHYVAPGELQPNGAVKNSVFNSWAINADIQNSLDNINKIIQFHRANGITFTRASFADLFHKKIDVTTLHNFIRTQAKELPIVKRRLDAYNSLANKIEEYHPKVSLADCNYSFLLKLEKTFLEKLKYMQSTASSNMSKLRAIITIAHKKKLITENPFTHYQVKGYDSNRQFLTKAELMAIENYYNSVTNPSKKNITAIFLFLCYTGIRIGDFSRLDFTDIKDGCIEFIQGKTKQRCFVPLSEPALRFIGVDSFTFQKISSVKINEGLKTIAIKTGITKPLTCHVARHTFATLSLQLGLDILTISKMLGHSKINTTMIYAKVLDESKKQEIAKWQGFLGF